MHWIQNFRIPTDSDPEMLDPVWFGSNKIDYRVSANNWDWRESFCYCRAILWSGSELDPQNPLDIWPDPDL